MCWVHTPCFVVTTIIIILILIVIIVIITLSSKLTGGEHLPCANTLCVLPYRILTTMREINVNIPTLRMRRSKL